MIAKLGYGRKMTVRRSPNHWEERRDGASERGSGPSRFYGVRDRRHRDARRVVRRQHRLACRWTQPDHAGITRARNRSSGFLPSSPNGLGGPSALTSTTCWRTTSMWSRWSRRPGSAKEDAEQQRSAGLPCAGWKGHRGVVPRGRPIRRRRLLELTRTEPTLDPGCHRRRPVSQPGPTGAFIEQLTTGTSQGGPLTGARRVEPDI